MKTVEIKDVLVEDRQRQDLGNLDNDFANIKDLGLIQPIVLENVGKTTRLIAGGRRLAWLAANGYTKLYHGVTCDPQRPGYVLVSELTDLARQEAELYENVKRQSLNWREECQAVARIHRARWIINKADAVAWSQKHTGRLLGVDYGKVGYALQIADELKRNPQGDLAKQENYTAAVRWLNAQADIEARKEQDRRRTVQLATTPTLDNLDLPPQINPLDPTEETAVTIHLSRMIFKGDFLEVARQDLAPSMFPVAMLYGPHPDLLPEIHRLLKADAVLIWLHGQPAHPDWLAGDFRYLGHPVIWNVLDEPADPEVPFFNNQYHISILIKGQPQFPNPSPTSVVSAASMPGGYAPEAVMDFLLRATSISGDQVLLPTRGPVGIIVRLGRVPISCDPDREIVNSMKSILMEHYSEIYPKVEYK